MTRYGYTEDYEYNATHKRIYFTIWSGPFSEVWEADGYATPGAKQVTLNTYAQTDKVVVKLPDGVTFPRTDENYQQIDAAINAALNAWEQKRGSVQLLPDSRSVAEAASSSEMLVTWRVTEETTYRATVPRAMYEQIIAGNDSDLGDYEESEYEIAHDSERVVTETEAATPDLPPGDDGRPTEHPDPVAPGADDI